MSLFALFIGLDPIFTLCHPLRVVRVLSANILKILTKLLLRVLKHIKFFYETPLKKKNTIERLARVEREATPTLFVGSLVGSH